MKTPKIGKLFVIITLLLFIVIAGVLLVSNINSSYRSRIMGARAVLMFSRQNIKLFAEQNGRFPDSLHELNEYGKKFPPEETTWHISPKEYISGTTPNSRENRVLDGTGGLYYNPETGELKFNLTKPLKLYWRFYFGKERNSVPADW